MIIYHDFSGEFDFFSIILPEKSKIIFPQVNKTVIKLLETVIKIYRCYSNTIVYFFYVSTMTFILILTPPIELLENSTQSDPWYFIVNQSRYIHRWPLIPLMHFWDASKVIPLINWWAIGSSRNKIVKDKKVALSNCLRNLLVRWAVRKNRDL